MGDEHLGQLAAGRPCTRPDPWECLSHPGAPVESATRQMEVDGHPCRPGFVAPPAFHGDRTVRRPVVGTELASPGLARRELRLVRPVTTMFIDHRLCRLTAGSATWRRRGPGSSRASRAPACWPASDPGGPSSITGMGMAHPQPGRPRCRDNVVGPPQYLLENILSRSLAGP